MRRPERFSDTAEPSDSRRRYSSSLLVSADKEAPLLVGWSVHEKPSFESVEIEEDVPWADPLVRPPSGQPVKIGCSRLRTDVPVALASRACHRRKSPCRSSQQAGPDRWPHRLPASICPPSPDKSFHRACVPPPSTYSPARPNARHAWEPWESLVSTSQWRDGTR